MTEHVGNPSIVAAEEAVETARRLYGERHPQVAGALMDLAQEHEWAGDWADAERLLREVLSIEEAGTAPHATRVARALRQLAGVCDATDRPTEAADLRRQAADTAPQTVDDTATPPTAPPRPEISASPSPVGLRPICGILSVSLPFAAGALAMAYGAWHTTGWSAFAAMMLLLPPAFIASIVLGVCGIRRRERKRWLSVLGLLIGLGPAALMLLGVLFGG